MFNPTKGNSINFFGTMIILTNWYNRAVQCIEKGEPRGSNDGAKVSLSMKNGICMSLVENFDKY